MEIKDKNVISEELQTQIKEVLKQRNALTPCPRCGKSSFMLANGLFVNLLQTDIKSLLLSGQSIPTAVLICTNCGFVCQHALGVLGLLEKAEMVDKNG